jgi:hypothetical protein
LDKSSDDTAASRNISVDGISNSNLAKVIKQGAGFCRSHLLPESSTTMLQSLVSQKACWFWRFLLFLNE